MKNLRKFIPNIITPEEAVILYKRGSHFQMGEFPEIIDRIKKVIEENITPDIADWNKPSIIRIENNIGGHKWHIDTGGDYGTKGHMMWCAYGASLLLVDDEDAGYLEYRDGTKLLPKEHFCGLSLHSSDIEHKVTENKTRRTLLIFTQRKL